MNAIIAGLFFALGLIFGSFLNVCIYRMPRGRSVVSPGSACPQCGSPVRPYDNIPVLSWLVLGGRCRDCRARITPRYMLVELATGLLFVGCFLAFGLSWAAVKYCIFTFLLLGLMFTDYETRLLPDLLTLPGLAIGIGFSVLVPVHDVLWDLLPLFVQRPLNLRLLSLGDSVFGAFIGAGFLMLARVVYFSVRGVEGMGLGDVKLMAMVGAFLGAKLTLVTIFGASLLGTAVGLSIAPVLYSNKKRYWVARGKLPDVARQRAKRAAFRNRLPFGVFLGAVALALTFFGHQLVTWYLYRLI